jgi:ABC-type nitrate/sulfonate/bicarbonate transport system permease component
MIAGLRGLGSRVANLAEGMNTAEMFAYIVFVIILAGILNLTLSTMQRRFAGPQSAS